MTWLNRMDLSAGPASALEVLLLAALIYYFMIFFRGTRGAAALTGFVFTLVVLMILTRLFHLDTLNWLIRKFSYYVPIAFLVLFQSEIRHALTELGKQHVFRPVGDDRVVIDNLIKTVLMLAERKIGALIGVERQVGLRTLVTSGTVLDSRLTPELLASIFFPHTPLHDGGVIIRDGRIMEAGCVFPISQQEAQGKKMGTRHRAALGLTEESDAVALVVSEETGTISVALGGNLARGLDEERLRRVLNRLLLRSNRPLGRLLRVKEQLDFTPDPDDDDAPAGRTHDAT